MNLIKHGILASVTVLVLSSCCNTPIQGKAAPIELPNSITFPKVYAEELACLTDDVYNRLDDGRIMCRSRLKTLEKAINAYNDSLGN